MGVVEGGEVGIESENVEVSAGIGSETVEVSAVEGKIDSASSATRRKSSISFALGHRRPAPMKAAAETSTSPSASDISGAWRTPTRRPDDGTSSSSLDRRRRKAADIAFPLEGVEKNVSAGEGRR